MSSFTAIPDPGNALPGIQSAVVAIKQNMEILTGSRGAGSDAAITQADLISYGLLGADGRPMQDIATLLAKLYTVFSGTTPSQIVASRETLTANRTYYVRTDGSDSNTGLVNTAGGAFLTWQKAYDTYAGLDCATFAVTIEIDATTYTGALAINKTPVGGSGLTIHGAGSSTIISTTSAHAIIVTVAINLTVSNFKVQTTTGGNGIDIGHAGARVTFGTGLVFGAIAGIGIKVYGGHLYSFNNYTISGGGGNHLQCLNGIIEMSGQTITISGTPAFSDCFVDCQASGSSVTAYTVTFSGPATGKRFNAAGGGQINTFGGGANYFPGNSGGTGTNFGASPYGLYA